jgi:hypothetical protein
MKQIVEESVDLLTCFMLFLFRFVDELQRRGFNKHSPHVILIAYTDYMQFSGSLSGLENAA